MARLILLDSGPLGMIVRAPSKPHIIRCLAWVKTIRATGAVVVIPDIAHYEVRRELLRIRAVGSLRRLDYALGPRNGFKHLLITADAIIKAAEFWASVRQAGKPTSSNRRYVSLTEPRQSRMEWLEAGFGSSPHAQKRTVSPISGTSPVRTKIALKLPVKSFIAPANG